MIRAKLLDLCPSPIASKINGNFCTVVVMIFFPNGLLDGIVRGIKSGVGAARRARA